MIHLGNPDAIHTITMVTNPFCEPCTQVYTKIRRFVQHNENVRCQLVFSVYSESDQIAKIVDTIFDEKYSDYQDVLRFTTTNRLQVRRNQVEPTDVIFDIDNSSNQHLRWCEAAQIKATPTIFLGGYKMPNLYGIEDALAILSPNSHT